MNNNFIIISNSQERVSKYAKCLHDCFSQYSFVADYDSALYRVLNLKLNLLVIDNVDENKNLSKFVRDLRQIEDLEDLVIIIITKEQGCVQGLEALQAGADDYLSHSLVKAELAVRVKAHINKKNKNNEVAFEGIDIDLNTILPIEDQILIKKSLNYINSNISTLKKVDDLASYLDKSERHLNSIFTSHLGKTVFEYIRDLRMAKAKNLILKTRVLIVDIAEEIGYSSAENFSTAFKTAVGLSPTEYRKQKRLIKQ